MKKYFAFDLETTGVDIANDEPVEIAMSIVPEEGPYRILSFLVDPMVPISPEAQRVHGISRQDCNGGFGNLVVGHMITEFLWKNKVDGIVAFNGFRFDVPLLRNYIMKDKLTHLDDLLASLPVEDPALWYLAEKVYNLPHPTTNHELGLIANMKVPKGTRYNLKVLCDIYGIQLKDAHRADGDLRATIDLWRRMKSIRRINESRRDNGESPGSGAAAVIGAL